MYLYHYVFEYLLVLGNLRLEFLLFLVESDTLSSSYTSLYI